MSWSPDAPDRPACYDTTVGQGRALCWSLNIRCDGCGRLVVWSCERQAGLPQSLTLGALAKGASCSACGHVGALVYQTQDHGCSRAVDAARNAAADAARLSQAGGSAGRG